MESEKWVLERERRYVGVGVFPMSGLPHVTQCRHPVCQQSEERGGGREGEEKGERGTL